MTSLAITNEPLRMGRVRVIGYKRPAAPNLRDPKVVKRIIDEARKAARAESALKRGRR